MADGFVAAFQTASGLTVDYKEDFNDNEEWFAKNKEPLSRKQDIGADLVVPTEFMATAPQGARLAQRDQRHPGGPTRRTCDPTCSTIRPTPAASTPRRTCPAWSAWPTTRPPTNRPITKIDDLWDPAFKGKVSLLSDTQDGLGMIMSSQGNSPENPTIESVQKAVDLVKEQKDKGQIRRFTGNDYADDLAAGNIVIAQAYSGDVVQLQADNPDLEFVIPETGGDWFIDTMVIPYTTENQKAAEAWIDYVYDRANYAKLVAFTQYVPVLTDMTDELNKVDPKLAANPLINPPDEMKNNLKTWPALTDEQTQQFNTAYAAVTGS